MTQSNAPNEGREEKQPWTYDIDIHGTAFCFYKHNDFKFKATEPDLCKALNEYELLRDQLSKERETIKEKDTWISEERRVSTELGNKLNELEQSLSEEREIRKELVDALTFSSKIIDSLISKASELDKN